MGLGIVLVCDPAEADDVLTLTPDATVVGEIAAAEDGNDGVIIS